MRNLEPRIHFLDAARAFAACLGIVIHTAAGYLKYPVPQWPRFNEQYNFCFDFIAFGCHLFRMPIFFFLAGFFAYGLNKRWHLWGFIKNRFKRIAIPFIVLSFLIHLPLLLTRIVTHQIHSFSDFIVTFQNLSYLWFLEYLLLYYLFFLAAVSLFLKLPASTLERWCDWIKQWPVAYLGGAVIILNFAFLWLGKFWYHPIFLSYVPNIWLLAIYEIYFIFGILVAIQNDFNYFESFKGSFGLLGIVIYSVYLYLNLNFTHTEGLRILAVALYSVASFLLFAAFLSVCSYFFAKRNQILHYLAQASYWIYLSQVTLIFMCYQLTARYFDSLFSQFAVVVTLTFLLSLLIYSSYRLGLIFLKRIKQLELL